MKTAGIFLFPLFILVLVACSAPEPTPDIPATVEAEVQRQMAAAPRLLSAYSRASITLNDAEIRPRQRAKWAEDSEKVQAAQAEAAQRAAQDRVTRRF